MKKRRQSVKNAPRLNGKKSKGLPRSPRVTPWFQKQRLEWSSETNAYRTRTGTSRMSERSRAFSKSRLWRWPHGCEDPDSCPGTDIAGGELTGIPMSRRCDRAAADLPVPPKKL